MSTGNLLHPKLTYSGVYVPKKKLLEYSFYVISVLHLGHIYLSVEKDIHPRCLD